MMMRRFRPRASGGAVGLLAGVGYGEPYFPDAGDIIEYPVISTEQSVVAGMQTCLFCLGHEMDKKRAYYASLCMDEFFRLREKAAAENDEKAIMEWMQSKPNYLGRLSEGDGSGEIIGGELIPFSL